MFLWCPAARSCAYRVTRTGRLLFFGIASCLSYAIDDSCMHREVVGALFSVLVGALLCRSLRVLGAPAAWVGCEWYAGTIV